MKNNIHKFLVFGVLLFVVLGCSSIMKKIEGKPQIMSGTDGTYQLTVPGNWSKQTDLNKEATLQAANLREELYVIVIKEPKTDFPGTTTIDTVTNLVKDNIRATMPDGKFSEPLPTIINGYISRQFDVGGRVSGVDAKYLYAVVETSDNYYQIMTWTLANRYSGNKAKLQEVINSFKEIK